MTIFEFKGEYRFLSNFWPSPVVLDGFTYPTVEHAYQAAKFGSSLIRMEIRLAATPGDAKRAAGRLKKHIRKVWDGVRLEVMRQLLVQKFQHQGLRQMLCETGNARLQEGNTWGDLYWGVDLRTGDGHNMLGKLLMGIRAEVC